MSNVVYKGIALNQVDESSSLINTDLVNTQSIYKGFSSKQFRQAAAYKKFPTFGMSDVDLVKEDLLNHIYTEFGERPHMPNFGTRIPTLTFELHNQETVDIIDADLRSVFEYDPRVQLISLEIYPVPDAYSIVAVANLRYIELNLEDEFKLELK